MKDARKKSFYFQGDLLEVINEQAQKYGISFSKVVQDCVRLVTLNLHRLEVTEGTTAFRDEIRKGK